MKLATIFNDSGEVMMTSFVIKAGEIRYLGSAISDELIKCIPLCLRPSRPNLGRISVSCQKHIDLNRNEDISH